MIQTVTGLPADIDDLVLQSEAEGFVFVRRLTDEWRQQSNCFDRDGEVFFTASSDNRTVGVCGINLDPYVCDRSVARLRHLYVLPEFRAGGIGAALVRQCIEHSANHFSRIRLRVPDKNTGRFYELLGFSAISDSSASHVLVLN